LKRETTQTTDKIITSFLKQLAWPAQNDFPHLKHIYDNIKVEDNRPTREVVVQPFLQCAQSLNLKVLFDALDECKDEELGQLYPFVQRLVDTNVGVYITTRPHIMGHLKLRFPDAAFVEDIKADPQDIRGFLERRITNHREVVKPGFMEQIISTIGDGQGMYLFHVCQELTNVDFPWPSSDSNIFLERGANII
jgi:hypothetical protein